MDAEPVSAVDSTALLHHEKRKRRIAGVLAVLVLGGLGVGGYVVVTGMGDGMAEVASAYSALNTCMIGEPLAEGESIGVRMNGIELALNGLTGAERAERGADWPNECEVHAHRLSEAATSAPKGDALAAAAEKLASELSTHKAKTPDQIYSAVIDAAAGMSLTAIVDDAVRRPPKPKPRPSVDNLPAKAQLSADGFNPGHLHAEPFQSRDVYFLDGRGESAWRSAAV